MKMYTFLTALLLITFTLSANPILSDVKFQDNQIIYRVGYEVPDTATNGYVVLEQNTNLVVGTWKPISEWQYAVGNAAYTNPIPVLPQSFFRLNEILCSPCSTNLIPADAAYHEAPTPGGGYIGYAYLFDSLEIGKTYTIAFGKNEIEADNGDQPFYSTTIFVADNTGLVLYSDSVQPVTALLLKIDDAATQSH
jgi:hypothetical protein